jgi:hypothetical protein
MMIAQTINSITLRNRNSEAQPHDGVRARDTDEGTDGIYERRMEALRIDVPQLATP